MSGFSALILDFGGVLTSPLADSMEAFARESGIDLQDFVRAALAVYSGADDELVAGFETGTVSEDEFASRLADRLSAVSAAPVTPDGLIGRIWGGLEIQESMLTAVVRARDAGLKTGLLSNSWGLDYYPRDRLAELFDEQVISGEVGLRKPDPAIYELVVERLGVEAPACVFVDDHPGHLKAAQEIGMTTVLHRSPPETIEELEQLLHVPLT